MTVAIKRIRAPATASSARHIAQVVQEIQLLRNFQHEHLVRLIDARYVNQEIQIGFFSTL